MIFKLFNGLLRFIWSSMVKSNICQLIIDFSYNLIQWEHWPTMFLKKFQEIIKFIQDTNHFNISIKFPVFSFLLLKITSTTVVIIV